MPESKTKPYPEIEQLLVELARAYNWIGMYQAGHPSLAGRAETLHGILAAQISKEPSGHLLFGVAKDKVLYHDTFLGIGQHLVNRLTEALFLNQVATLDFSAEADPQGLLVFLRGLHDLAIEKTGGTLEAILGKAGVRGIGVYPYNYKDVLSRRIVSPDESGAVETKSGRENDLWRMLLTENQVDGDAQGERFFQELSVSPEMLPAILRRASAASEAGIHFATPEETAAEAVSPELVQKLLGRLGEMIGRLPADRKGQVLEFLDKGFEEMSPRSGQDGAALEYLFGQALTAGNSDEEFLDMIAAFLSAEEKGGRRLRKIFEIIASERNAGNGLMPKAREHVRESRRTKDYFAQKTWETVESFLLTRSEDAYIGQDHGNLLESISSLGGGYSLPPGTVPFDPAYAHGFTDESLHRKATSVLLELLTDDSPEDEYLGILEDIRKIIPNLVSRKEFVLLNGILSTLASIGTDAPDTRKPVIRGVIGEMDFAHVLDLYLSPELQSADRDAIQEIIVSFADSSIEAILDRLLTEGSKASRRTLLGLCARFAPVAVPAITVQLDDPHWYFVRNLCLILGGIGDLRAAPELMRMLEHDDYRVRREAIMALGKLRAQEAVSSLGRILLSESLLPSAKEDSLRIDAANAIFCCGGTRAASYLHRGLDCRRAIVKEQCASLLKTMRPA